MARQGQELFIAVDGLARRMRSLGFPAPKRLSAIIERSELDEEEGIVRGSAEDMIAQLATDHEAVARNIRTDDGGDNFASASRPAEFTARMKPRRRRARPQW